MLKKWLRYPVGAVILTTGIALVIDADIVYWLTGIAHTLFTIRILISFAEDTTKPKVKEVKQEREEWNDVFVGPQTETFARVRKMEPTKMWKAY